MTLADVIRIYEGSDGDATKAMYAELEQLGPIGAIAVNLFRAQKNSSRAKEYRGRGYKGAAYDRKQWSMGNLTAILELHGGACSIPWGWGEDAKQTFHKFVLYVDLPTGQVSFHTAQRGTGPTYAGTWDGVANQSAQRIVSWIGRLLATSTASSA